MDFYEDICEPIQYHIKDLKTGKERNLNSRFFIKNRVVLNGIYFFQEASLLILKNIELSQDGNDGNIIFTNKEHKKIVKIVKKTMLPLSILYINTP